MKTSFLIAILLFTVACSKNPDAFIVDEKDKIEAVEVEKYWECRLPYKYKTTQNLNKSTLSTVDTIVLSESGPPSAPEYQRQKVTTVTNNNIHIALYRYGNVLVAENNKKISNEEFQEIKQSFLDNEIRRCVLITPNNCEPIILTGSSSFSFSLLQNEQTVFSSYDSDYEGDMCGDAKSVKKLIRSLSPKE